MEERKQPMWHPARVVAGGRGRGNRMDQLYGPADLALLHQNERDSGVALYLFVADMSSLSTETSCVAHSS